MQDFKELILLLQQHNVHPLKHLAGSEDSKLFALYEGIQKGKYDSDEVAAADIYGDKAGGSGYRKLKSDLRERLLEAVLHLNTAQEQYNDYQKAYYDCNRMWLLLRFLTGQNANTAAMTVANRLLRQAEKFDFTLLCMDVCSYLRIQYALRESNDKRYQEANQQFKYYQKVHEAESLAEELYTQLVVRTVNNRSAQDEVVQQADAFYDMIAPYMEEFHSYKLHMYGYMIGLIRYTTVNDFTGALALCNKAIAFFEGRPYTARVPLQIFYYQALICNVQLRLFEEGNLAAQKCTSMMQEGTFNWFKYRELYLHLLLHTHKYEEAGHVLLETLKHPRFQFLPENAQEIWRIYEAYVYMLALAGKMPSPFKGKFKLAKFISDIQIFSKDKSGMNVALLVIRLMFFIQEKNYGKLLDEVDAVDQYCYRHLRGAHTVRSYNFLKMLLQIPLGQFDPEVIRGKAARYQEVLQANPLQVANQTYEIEILPYEDLWEMAMDVLKS